jgi:hypothetical protein
MTDQGVEGSRGKGDHVDDFELDLSFCCHALVEALLQAPHDVPQSRPALLLIPARHDHVPSLAAKTQDQ